MVQNLYFQIMMSLSSKLVIPHPFVELPLVSDHAAVVRDPLRRHANLGVNMHSSVSEMQTLWYNL